MTASPSTSKLDQRVARDQTHAELAVAAAKGELASLRLPSGEIDPRFGPTAYALDRADHVKRRAAALEAIAAQPFHAMVEVCTELSDRNGPPVEKQQLWYANTESSVNEVLQFGNARVAVLAWTHPGVQVALTSELGKIRSVRENGYNLLSVEPLARARFDATLPVISAVYQPGGGVRPQKPAEVSAGLKAVKLDMTRDQVLAFISRMSGLMVVTGAPGSGKTTVAFQRIRFLFDQQRERMGGGRLVPYSPELTRVFLANEGLAEQAKTLLTEALEIPASVVEPVGGFIEQYLDAVWLYKHNARPRQRHLPSLEAAARAAVLGLSVHRDLLGLWRRYEQQIAARLETAPRATWTSLDPQNRRSLNELAQKLQDVAGRAPSGENPLSSALRMSAIFSATSREYAAARSAMPTMLRNRFDEAFQQWLYYVYDPLAALAAYVGSDASEAAHRMRKGTGARVDEAAVLRDALAEWTDRNYGPEDRPWLAWLLRFALPEETDPQQRFREVPSSIGPALSTSERWTHIVIDEAQDLCVAEASLIGSLVDPDGALTISADFRQIVSPVHGMQNTDALRVGRSLHGTGAEQIYPFAKNMRQSRQIGRFLQGFYEAAFRERPTFEVNAGLLDRKPQLIVAPPQHHPLRIKQLVTVLGRSEVVRSIALLQINEDERFLTRLRSELERAGVALAPLWSPTGEGLVTSSVERVKGLEFDACIVLGLEDVESAALNYTLNRAYVALSRPTRRLVLISDEFPSLLRRVDRELFDAAQS